MLPFRLLSRSCCRNAKTKTTSTASTRAQLPTSYRPSTKRDRFPKRSGDYLFGIAPCLAAVQAKRRKIYNIFFRQGVFSTKSRLRREALEIILAYAKRKDITVRMESKDVMERLSGKKPHQGMVMDVQPLKYSPLDPKYYKMSLTVKQRKPVWLALDEVQDPMNFGAVLRCAYFLGIERVVATAKNSCSLSPVVSKASAGALELMQVYSVGSMPDFLKDAAESGWHVLGTCSPNEEKEKHVPVIDCCDYALQGPTILVVGNEGKGLGHTVEQACTSMLTIKPLRTLPTGFDSLNVSVATGILLHILKRTSQTTVQS